jgi:hypothetical protein
MKKSDKWYDKFMYVLGLPEPAMTKYSYHKAERYEMATAESGVKSRIAVLNSGLNICNLY